jgi:HK97 family phage prohead protease
MAAQAPRNGREQRRITLDSVEVRADATGDEIRVNGHAAVWDKPAWIGPPKFGFSERFQPGAFKESINGGADVRYLFNHNPDAVLARTKSGTLRLGEDASGLTVDADLAPTSIGRDLAILMSRGDVNQMSVGMQVLEDRWEEASGNDGNLYEQRTIIRAKLFDVSAVTYPAYEDTDAGLRDADLARELRDARGVHVVRRSQGKGIRSDTSDVTITGNVVTDDSNTGTPSAPEQTPPAEGGETPESPAFTNEHRKAPRLKCPACNRPATATER